MDPFDVAAEFRRELPFFLSCTAVTADKSARQILRFLKWQPEPFPACFTRSHIMRYLEWLNSTPPERRDKARREPGSVNDILKGIRRFARWAVARGYVMQDPAADIKGLPARDRVILAPEPVAVRQFLNTALAHGENPEMTARNFAIGCVLVDAGVRAAELLAMDLGDVVAGPEIADMAVIKGKWSKERLIPLNAHVRTALRLYIELRRSAPGEGALWIDTNGHRLTYSALRNTIKRICQKAGVHINLHDFRRFTHTQLWLQGIDQIDGMLLSGHANERDYRLYIRAAMQVRAVEKARDFSPLAMVL